jgi:RNA polymerase sigma factor (sigma-70 family)
VTSAAPGRFIETPRYFQALLHALLQALPKDVVPRSAVAVSLSVGHPSTLEGSPEMIGVLDSELLRAARDGRQEAFTVLYQRHVGAARREARRRCRRSATADDAVAAAFASVFRSVMNGGGPDEHFRAYLLTAVRNAMIDQSRRREIEYVPLPDAELPDESHPVPSGDRLGESLGAAFLSLSERQRDALWKTEVDGCTNSEMAELLGLSVNAFAALKKRARQNLCSAYVRELTGDDELCTWIAERVDVIVAGALGHALRLMVDLHLDGCDVCATLIPERERRTAPLLGLPLLLTAPAICRLRGPTPTWWPAARGLRAAGGGSQHAAVVVGLVAGVAAVVVLVSSEAESRQASEEMPTTVLHTPMLGEAPLVTGQRADGEAVQDATPHLPDSRMPERNSKPRAVAADREHRAIAGAAALPDVPGAAAAPTLAAGSGAGSGAVDAGTGAATDGEPEPTPPPPEHGSTPSPTTEVSATTTAPSSEESTADTATATTTAVGPAAATTIPTTVAPIQWAAAISTTTTTTTTTTPPPPLIGTIATTTTMPPLIGTIATTTTTPPLIGTIATTTTTAPPVIGRFSS